MKVRTLNGLSTVIVVTLLLIPAIIFIPFVPVRLILALPLLLFFPGYSLLTALFITEKRMDGLERAALSCGMSIAVVGLIGFALNYTKWGVTLSSSLYCVAAFVLVTSVVGLVRRMRSSPSSSFPHGEFNIRLPNWGIGGPDMTVLIFLIGATLVAGGVLGYVSVTSRAREQFTQFYVLGLDGKAQNYPTEFVMDGRQTTHIKYENGSESDGQWGYVRLGIVSHERGVTAYTVTVTVGGQPVDIDCIGGILAQVRIELNPGDTWEQPIGFAPQHTGDNQKIEFLLSKDTDGTTQDSLNLWVNAK